MPWLLLLACAPDRPTSGAGAGELTLRSYTETCETLLGPLPDLHCDDGVLVPITVTGPDGETREVHDPSALEDGTDCDQPSPISGCTSGSRAGSVRTEQATFHFVCRRYAPETVVPPGDRTIGHGYSRCDRDGSELDPRLARGGVVVLLDGVVSWGRWQSL